MLDPQRFSPFPQGQPHGMLCGQVNPLSEEFPSKTISPVVDPQSAQQGQWGGASSLVQLLFINLGRLSGTTPRPLAICLPGTSYFFFCLPLQAPGISFCPSFDQPYKSPIKKPRVRIWDANFGPLNMETTTTKTKTRKMAQRGHL